MFMKDPDGRDIYDISRTLSAGTPCWPGDVPFAFRFSGKIRDGATVNVGAIESSVHNGTHCDAPFHYDDAGLTIERIAITTFVGPAYLVDVRNCLEDWSWPLRRLDFSQTPRILFRTDAWLASEQFPDHIPTMAQSMPDWLGQRGVILVGVDLPSVDALDSKTLDNHHALGKNGITILEGLWLDQVPEGRYELIAPPLKIKGADGSPMRALLRSL
jgi:arylformamidase